jgi:hypothetical protein
LISKWKHEHEARIAAVFGAVEYSTRIEARKALDALTAKTRVVYQRVGPNNEYKGNPEADEATEWKHHIQQTIIPTNRSVLALLDRNRSLLLNSEMETVELFRQHIEGIEQRHIFAKPLPTSPQYPASMNNIFK